MIDITAANKSLLPLKPIGIVNISPRVIAA